jgi:uncharacterized protein (DUF111 family)
VFSTAIQMKKDRPGTLVSVLCGMNNVEKLESILFDETGTFGIRRTVVERSKRSRREHTVQTAWGPVRGKLGWRQGEECLFTPEFEDCARLAGEKGIPLREIYRAAESAFQPSAVAPAAQPTHTHRHDHGSHTHDHSHDHAHDHHHGK